LESNLVNSAQALAEKTKSDVIVEHKTKFDSEMVPGLASAQAAFPLSNSRQIVRTRSGNWLLSFDVPGKGLFLCYSLPGATQGSQLSQTLLLVSHDDKGVLSTGFQPMGISLAISHKTLHLAWSDKQGVWLATTSLPSFSSPDSFETSFRQ